MATKTEIKHEAQDHLLTGLRAAFDIATNDGVNDAVKLEMSKQMARIEKMFGYEPFSTPRGI